MKKLALYSACTFITLLLWEYFGRSSNSARLLISYPSLILSYFVDHIELLGKATLITLVESSVGLLLAMVFTFLIMLGCFYFPPVLRFLLPAMVTSQVIPLITLAPLLIMIFGIGIKAKIVMAALMCFFPLFINFLSGYISIPRTTNDLLYLYAASTWFKIIRVNIPLALPSIFAGLKISATLSVIGSIVAEFNGADYGLGKNLYLAAKRLEPELMMTSILLTSLLGGIMYGTMWLLERKFGKWYL
jgi:ABC-type nitrate/sulfonate/bicarbonate transport system permease component